MLQQIATANADIAAFTLEPPAAVGVNLKSADEFAYMLKHQQTDNQRSAQSDKSSQVPTGTPDPEPGAEQTEDPAEHQLTLPPGEKQPGVSKDGLEEESAAPSTLNEETKALVGTAKDSHSQVNSQNDAESVNVVEENQWLLLVEKLVNDALDSGSQSPDPAGHNLSSATKVQQEAGEQLNDSGEGVNGETSEAQGSLAAMLSSVFSTNQKDGELSAELQGEVDNLLQQNPKISEAFAQLLKLHKQAAGEQGDLPEAQIGEAISGKEEQPIAAQPGTDILPPQEQELLEVLLADAIVATASLQSPPQNELTISSLAPGEAKVEGTTPVAQLPVALDQTPDSEAPAVLPDASLAQIIQLPKDKLDKVLTYLEQKLTGGEITAKIMHSASVTEQQAANVGLDNILDKTAGGSDFVAALKTGIAEVKAQLSQGREPGIDLKSLVNEALKVTGEPGQSGVVKLPEQQLDLTLKAFNQTLEFAQQLNSALDQSSQLNVAHNSFRESGQLQGEQVKSSQLHTGQLDKGLNLAKPEAHQQLAEKVRWMVNTTQLVADIRLDPAELGSMHVKVSLAGESANVSFVVNSAQAKEAVDNATPKLREMLAEKGIELGQSSVDQEQNTQGQEQQTAGNNQHSGQEESEEGSIHDQVIQQPIVNGALGGIDYFV